MARVLLIDGDPISVAAMTRVLADDLHEVAWAASGRAGLAMVSEFRPEAAIVDCALKDATLSDLIGKLNELNCRTLLLTRFGYDEDARAARRLGVFECLEQPINAQMLSSAVRYAIMGDHATNDYALNRWAGIVLRGASSPRDLPRLVDWSRFIGASVGAIRNWCQTAGVAPKHSLQLTRGLRAVLLPVEGRGGPENVLDIVDKRTLSKFLLAAGGNAQTLPATADDYLRLQRFVLDGRALEALRTSLGESEPASV